MRTVTNLRPQVLNDFELGPSTNQRPGNYGIEKAAGTAAVGGVVEVPTTPPPFNGEWGDFRGIPPRDDAVEVVDYYPGPGGSALYSVEDW